MQNEAVDLIDEGGRIRGVVAKTPAGQAEIRADLVVGCDGRHSLTRKAAHFEVLEQGVPIDVLWFRISRSRQRSGEPVRQHQLRIGADPDSSRRLLPDRAGHSQGFVRADSARRASRRFGTKCGRSRRSSAIAWRSCAIGSRSSCLSVQINRLRQWHRPGLLCIGDAAHAMSPVGGVGINLAIQDAVATANLLGDALRERRVSEAMLARVQAAARVPHACHAVPAGKRAQRAASHLPQPRAGGARHGS